jgi:hypothetical protein
MKNFILKEEVLARKKLSTSNATEARRIKVLVTNTVTNEKKEYKSLTEAAKVLNVTKGAVSQALINNKLLKKLYKIEKTV